MPRVVSDIVDVYVFRRLNGRVQFLLLQRKPEVSMANTWQAFHSQIKLGNTTLETVREVVTDAADLQVDEVYSADYINQFYDEGRDAMVLSPVFAVTVKAQAPVRLSAEYADAGWFDRTPTEKPLIRAKPVTMLRAKSLPISKKLDSSTIDLIRSRVS